MSKPAILVLILSPLPELDTSANYTDPVTWANYRDLIREMGLWEGSVGLLSFSTELNWARKTYLNPYPPKEDLARFPSLEVVLETTRFNEEFTNKMEIERFIYPAAYYDDVIGRCEVMRERWDLLKRIHEDKSWLRRFRLAMLRDHLGEEAYYAGRMPPHVPLWAFQEK